MFVEKNEMLVSVIVVSYNSSKTIIETLESVYSQTYNNIELIVSDDASQDDTVSKCSKWIEQNKNRFKNVELLTVLKNTGTSGNLNRGYEKATGRWVKQIAGDDVLVNTCVEDNVDYILSNPTVDLVFSKIIPFGTDKIVNKYKDSFKYGFFDLSTNEQHCLLLLTNYIPAPTLFIKKESIEKLGYFDDTMPLLDDWPSWIRALKAGMTLSFINKFTVYYRMSESSTSLASSPNKLYIQSIKRFQEEVLPVYQKEFSLMLWCYSRFLYLYHNSINFCGKILYLILIVLNPMFYYVGAKYHKLNKYSHKYR